MVFNFNRGGQYRCGLSKSVDSFGEFDEFQFEIDNQIEMAIENQIRMAIENQIEMEFYQFELDNSDDSYFIDTDDTYTTMANLILFHFLLIDHL